MKSEQEIKDRLSEIEELLLNLRRYGVYSTKELDGQRRALRWVLREQDDV